MTQMENIVIDVHHLSRLYNPDTIPVHALSDVHLHIERGEFTVVKGPSGSGKTTMLNLIGGLDAPTSGEVIINGMNLGDLHGNDLVDFRLHNIGFVFQAYNLIPVLTAYENIEFIMLLQGIEEEERKKEFGNCWIRFS